MGYTHYWEHFTDVTREQWADFAAGARRMFADAVILARWDGDADSFPELTEDKVSFNGIGDESCESFVVNRRAEEWTFCKTSGYAYDAHVTACLLALCACCPTGGFKVSSDGSAREWADGYALARKYWAGSVVLEEGPGESPAAGVERVLQWGREDPEHSDTDDSEEPEIDPDDLVSYQELVRSNVETTGRHINYVMPEDESPAFAYTVGHSLRDLPELIVFGVGAENSVRLLNALAELVTPETASGDKIAFPGAEFSVILRDATERALRGYALVAERFAESYGVPARVWQVVVPDTAGRYPGDADCESPYSDHPRLWENSESATPA